MMAPQLATILKLISQVHNINNITSTQYQQLEAEAHAHNCLEMQNSGVKREAFSSIYFKFSKEKFLLAKVKYGTYFSENARLQGWGYPEYAIATS